ncbi:HDIG domain-containing protein [Mariniphaga anaerophila]|uniref:HDIG domain-containing protein n=1 Tax=Mariniphaga anaerophila TaxID=1484053 RepID=A0A1M4VRI9_9BACT|nr:HD domain-containing protein [Mariniphaga anaerophila]SHE71569.1 HDIG domain-containing protein [Mariniphaga anaerophila]
MVEKVNQAQSDFSAYYSSFSELTEQQRKNFEIKYEHSLRVAQLCQSIAEELGWEEDSQNIAYITGLFHDIGRFKQLVEFGSFNDTQSVDHAQYSVEVLQEKGFLNSFSEEQQAGILDAILYHNKRELPGSLAGNALDYAKLLRDADKLDILKVITDYYGNPKAEPNHTLTWDLPRGSVVSPAVAKQIIAGKLVDKELVESELDIKIMQLSWVFDLNFKPSFKILMGKRFPEKIYATLSKNDTVIQIYRTVKVYSENKVVG